MSDVDSLAVTCYTVSVPRFRIALLQVVESGLRRTRQAVLRVVLPVTAKTESNWHLQPKKEVERHGLK